MAGDYQLLPGTPPALLLQSPFDDESQSLKPRSSPRRRQIRLALLFMIIILLSAIPIYRFTKPQRRERVALKFASGKSIPNAKVAFATLLTGGVADKDAPADTDNYFVAARMLCYQILHDPVTRTRLNAPCLVMTTPSVRQDKIDQLREDGATIVPVEFIRSDWAKTTIDTWQDVLSKIYLWNMTQYDLIAFLDTDRVLIKPLDGLFFDPAVVVLDNKNLTNYIKADEGPQPSEYLFASTAEMTKKHHFPPKTEPQDWYNIHYFEAGTVIMRPSKEMFDHHLNVLSIKDRFDSHLPEQNLWNYIYRHDGNMPWIQIDPIWSAHFPTLSDIEAGAASIHEKFWFPTNQEMKPFLLAARDKMLRFYRDRSRSWSKDMLKKLEGHIHSIQDKVHKHIS